ncbi:hypothetical protein ACHAXM_006766 [Skeletonema potamos]
MQQLLCATTQHILTTKYKPQRNRCPSAQDEDCPGGETCFGGTECYADLVPTPDPAFIPTNPPSTLPPVSYDDPANNRFCGLGWADAVENCSIETYCPSGNSEDCPEGQSCHGGLPNSPCNIVDLWEKFKNAGKPSPHPTMPPLSKDDLVNTKFCGASWALADSNCSLETHCPDDICPTGLICYGGTKCNAFDMTRAPTKPPTMQPTNTPTPPQPTVSPYPTASPSLPTQPTSTPSTSGPSKEGIPADDIRHSFWCGKDWADVTKNCLEPCTSGEDTECSDSTMKCFAFTSCRPGPKPTIAPTKEPTQPTTPQPSLQFTEQLSTLKSEAPMNAQIVADISEAPISSAPSSRPTSYFVTNEPTTITSLAISENTSDEVKTLPPTNHLSQYLTSEPTMESSEFQTNSPTAKKVSLVMLDQAPSPSLIARIGSILVSAKSAINEKVLLSRDSLTGKAIPTQRYLFGGFVNALGVVSKGQLGSSYFYLGQGDDPAAASNVNYGLINVALLISQAAVETVMYDVCDEVSWEKDIYGRYPLSNSCGQGRSSGVSDASYDATNQCTDEESDVACPVDPAMTAIAETMVTWEGAPPPFECFPATDDNGTGSWDSTLSCTAQGCSYYDGQVKGGIDPDSIPSSNSFGRNNVEGCCWWGRGAFPRGSAGTCMIGKLNYYLGKRAYDDGRSSARYGELDFCKDPSAICRGYYDDSEKNAEIRWMMGILYWIRNVQTYNKDGFSFIERLHQFVDSDFSDPPDFFEDVSRIVSRGCHLKSCGSVVSGDERKRIFEEVVLYFNAQPGPSSSQRTLSPTNIPSMKEPINSAKPTSRTPTSRTNIPTTPPALSASSTSDSTLNQTASPVTPKLYEYTSDDVTNLSEEELKHRMNNLNHYCAASLEEVESKCATTLRTCNSGEPLCSLGQACFGNILCSAASQFIPQTEATSSINCGGSCLRLLTVEECESGSKTGAFLSLSSCSNVRVGEICKSNGECGDTANVGSCPGGQNVFMRVDGCHSILDSITSTGEDENQTASKHVLDGSSLATIPTEPIEQTISGIEDQTSTGEDENQTASKHMLNGSSIATIPTGPIEQTVSGEEDQKASLTNAWWRDENNRGSIKPNASLLLICNAIAALILMYKK